MPNIILSRLREGWKRAWHSAMLFGVFGTGIRVGANLLLLPLVLTRLSSAELELWWVFLALGEFGNLADFGFGATIPRIYSYLFAGADDFTAEGVQVAKTGGAPNFSGIRRFNATVRSLYLKISLAAVALLAIFGTLMVVRPAMESGLGAKVWCIWAVFMFVIGYNLSTVHWAFAAQGLNQIRGSQVVYVWSGLSYVACAALLLVCKQGLATMVVASFVRSFVNRWKFRRIYRQVVPNAEKTEPVDPQIVKKLWPNSWKFGVLAINGFCLSKGNVLICSQFLGQKITDSFGLTAQIGAFLVAFASLWLAVKWPQIAILRTQGQLHEMGVLFARRLTLVMFSFVALELMVFFAGNPLLAWKGTHTRLLAAPYLAIYFVYLVQQILYVQFAMLAFTENVVPFFRVSLYTGLGVIAGSLILTPLFGLWGLLVAPFLAEMACCTWYVVRRGFQGQPLSVRSFCRAAIYRTP